MAVEGEFPDLQQEWRFAPQNDSPKARLQQERPYAPQNDSSEARLQQDWPYALQNGSLQGLPFQDGTLTVPSNSHNVNILAKYGPHFSKDHIWLTDWFTTCSPERCKNEKIFTFRCKVSGTFDINI